MKAALILIASFALVSEFGTSHAQTPFASLVVEFSPAPGQWVNNPLYNDPQRALGAPVGGGTSVPDNSSIVSLGGFGGSITLGFDHTVENDPLNPMGLDAIVFTNAVWVFGDPLLHFGECAVIEIAYDANKNGLPDAGEWYLIPGSHLPKPSDQYHVQTWDDNITNQTHPPRFISWIPPGQSGTWFTEGYLLPPGVFGGSSLTNPSADSEIEGIWGYAEYTPTLRLGDLNADNVVDDGSLTPHEFYTVPDDPFTVGISPGSGGGDAFDIDWAIHPITGEFAHLPGFDFIRITNAVNSVHGPLGEMSPEIDAVTDVIPDPTGDADGDGDIDLADVADFQFCVSFDGDVTPECVGFTRNESSLIELVDWNELADRMTGPR